MCTFSKRFFAMSLGVCTALTLGARPTPAQNFIPGVSPFYQIRPGLNISQAAYSMRQIGTALRSFPPPVPFNYGNYGNP